MHGLKHLIGTKKVIDTKKKKKKPNLILSLLWKTVTHFEPTHNITAS